MARHARKGQDRRTAWKVALALWCLLIWVHSLIPGPASSEESLAVLRLLRPVFEALGIRDSELMHLVVRKGAHFSEYLVLGVLAVIALRPRLAPPLAPALGVALLWGAVPCIDEVIQLHVPGRAGAIRDVLIDMGGYLVGLLVSLGVRRVLEAREARRAPKGRHAPGVPAVPRGRHERRPQH